MKGYTSLTKMGSSESKEDPIVAPPPGRRMSVRKPSVIGSVGVGKELSADGSDCRQFEGVPDPPRAGDGSTWPGAFGRSPLRGDFSPYPESGPGRSHTRGVYGEGYFQTLPRLADEIPENLFFQPGKAYSITVRHSDMSNRDNAGMDIRGMAIKFAQKDDVASPLDLLLTTGEASPWWSATSLSEFENAHVGGVDALKDWFSNKPASYSAYINSLKRCPKSYASLYYYSHSSYELASESGIIYNVTFRVRPAGEFLATHSSTDPPDEALPRADQQNPWYAGRLKSLGLEADYLITDYKERLRLRPVIYWLQASIVSPENEEDADYLNPSLSGNRRKAKWISLGEIIITEWLPNQKCENVFFESRNCGDVIRRPPTSSPNDFNSVLAARELTHSSGIPTRNNNPTENVFESDLLMRHEGLHGGLSQYVIRIAVGNCKSSREMNNNVAVYVTLIGQRDGIAAHTEPLRLTHWADNTFSSLSMDEWVVYSPIQLDEISLISLSLKEVSCVEYSRWLIKRVEVLNRHASETPWKPGHIIKLRTSSQIAKELERFDFSCNGESNADDHGEKEGRILSVIDTQDGVPQFQIDVPNSGIGWYPCTCIASIVIPRGLAHHEDPFCSQSESAESTPSKPNSPYNSIGLDFELGRLVSVVEGSCGDLAGLEYFIGHRLTHINHDEVSEQNLNTLFDTTSDPTALYLTFEPEEGPVIFPAYCYLEKGDVLLFEGTHMLLHKEHDSQSCLVRRRQLHDKKITYTKGCCDHTDFLPKLERSNFGSGGLDLRKLFERKSKELLLRDLLDGGSKIGKQPFEILTGYNDLYFTMQSFDQTPLPMRQEVWMNDLEYGRQFVDGALCLTIERYNHNAVTSSSSFCVKDYHLQDALCTSKTISELESAGVLFIADFSIVRDLPCRSGCYLAAPVILFYYSKEVQSLLPVVIQLNPGDAFLWTPRSCTTAEWTIAKTLVMCAGAHVVFFGHKIARTMMGIEHFVLATKRYFSDSHPLFKLLYPHCAGTLAAIAQVKQYLLSEDGLCSVFSLSHSGQTLLIERFLRKWTLDNNNHTSDIINRGVDSIEGYTYRDFGYTIESSIETYISNMLSIMYITSQDYLDDIELGEWCKDLKIKVPDKEGLTKLLTTFVYSVSVRQAVLSHCLWDTFGCVPYSPFACYEAPPVCTQPARSDEEVDTYMLDILPGKSSSAHQVVLTWMLATSNFTPLSDAYQLCDVLNRPQETEGALLPLSHWNEDLTLHPDLHSVHVAFQNALVQAADSFDEINSNLVYPYVYLSPYAIPNSVTPPPVRRV